MITAILYCRAHCLFALAAACCSSPECCRRFLANAISPFSAMRRISARLPPSARWNICARSAAARKPRRRLKLFGLSRTSLSAFAACRSDLRGKCGAQSHAALLGRAARHPRHSWATTAPTFTSSGAPFMAPTASVRSYPAHHGHHAGHARIFSRRSPPRPASPTRRFSSPICWPSSR